MDAAQRGGQTCTSREAEHIVSAVVHGVTVCTPSQVRHHLSCCSSRSEATSRDRVLAAQRIPGLICHSSESSTCHGAIEWLSGQSNPLVITGMSNRLIKGGGGEGPPNDASRALCWRLAVCKPGESVWPASADAFRLCFPSKRS